MLKNKRIRRLIVAISAIFLLLLFMNIILESILKNKISSELNLLSQEDEYTLGIKDVDINIFRGHVSISDFYAKPTELFFESFAKGTIERDVLKELFVSKASLSGLGLFNLLIKKELKIDKIEIDELDYNFYRPEKKYHVNALKKENESTFSLDSIHIPGIEKIDLTEMQIEDYGLYVIDASSRDTISSYEGKELLFSGLNMDEIAGNTGYFTFDHSELELQLKQQEFDLNGGLYTISFDDLHYKYYEQEIKLIHFELKPVASTAEFSARFNQVYDIITSSVDTLLISGVDSDPLFQSGIISIEQIDIKGLKADLFKDKTKPWDLDKVTILPQKALENMQQPLHIKAVNIHNSSFVYSEKLPDTDQLVKVNLENIQGQISYITSIRDSVNNKKNLEVKLNTDLLNILPASLNISIPYNTPNDSFYVSGYSKGTTDFARLNPIVFPAIGLKFENGSLDGMNFNFIGNNTKSTGKLTMLYKDLEVEVFRENQSENKTISWVANTFIKKSNPSKRGRTVVADIDFERIEYKGFGNYLWKSIQSGVVNSLVPFGKCKKKVI